MATKCTNIFLSKALQNIPRLGFLYENKPSCNHGVMMNKECRSYADKQEGGLGIPANDDT
jgi:hypothetical protein